VRAERVHKRVSVRTIVCKRMHATADPMHMIHTHTHTHTHTRTHTHTQIHTHTLTHTHTHTHTPPNERDSQADLVLEHSPAHTLELDIVDIRLSAGVVGVGCIGVIGIACRRVVRVTAVLS
jgi:hypothetical protein